MGGGGGEGKIFKLSLRRGVKLLFEKFWGGGGKIFIHSIFLENHRPPPLGRNKRSVPYKGEGHSKRALFSLSSDRKVR